MKPQKESEIFPTVDMIRDMRKLGLSDKVFPTSQIIDGYFMKAKEKGKSEGYSQAQRERLKSELKFLESHFIKDLVQWADIGACHEDYEPIENRKKKLKAELSKLEGKTK